MAKTIVFTMVMVKPNNNINVFHLSKREIQITTFLLFSERAFRQLAFFVGHEVRSLHKHEIIDVNNIHRLQRLPTTKQHQTLHQIIIFFAYCTGQPQQLNILKKNTDT